MKVKQILARDDNNALVLAIYECRFCGHTWEGVAGDHVYFLERLMPEMQCPSCGKSLKGNGKELEDEE